MAGETGGILRVVCNNIATCSSSGNIVCVVFVLLGVNSVQARFFASAVSSLYPSMCAEIIRFLCSPRSRCRRRFLGLGEGR